MGRFVGGLPLAVWHRRSWFDLVDFACSLKSWIRAVRGQNSEVSAASGENVVLRCDASISLMISSWKAGCLPLLNSMRFHW
jgi:hypothetical protein